MTTDDFGQYTCKASNKLGFKEKIINLSGKMLFYQYKFNGYCSCALYYENLFARALEYCLRNSNTFFIQGMKQNLY